LNKKGSQLYEAASFLIDVQVGIRVGIFYPFVGFKDGAQTPWRGQWGGNF
jgi:hypothetical protein